MKQCEKKSSKKGQNKKRKGGKSLKDVPQKEHVYKKLTQKPTKRKIKKKGKTEKQSNEEVIP